MNGSNHLAEMDQRPFCFRMRAKSLVGLPRRSAEPVWSLADFAKRPGLDAEAAFWQKSADRLGE